MKYEHSDDIEDITTDIKSLTSLVSISKVKENPKITRFLDYFIF